MSWTKVLSSNVEDIVFVPGTSTVYAGLIGAGVKKSMDGGATWVCREYRNTVNSRRLRLAMAPSDSNVLYALVPGRTVHR